MYKFLGLTNHFETKIVFNILVLEIPKFNMRLRFVLPIRFLVNMMKMMALKDAKSQNVQDECRHI